MIKKFLIVIFILNIFVLNSFSSMVVDDSIHTEIAEKYDINKLPDLPAHLINEVDIFTPDDEILEPTSKYEIPKTELKKQIINAEENKKSVKKNNSLSEINNSFSLNNLGKNVVKIDKGKKFKAVNITELSDRLKKGSVVAFVTTAPETDTYITIPKGTIFKGTVVDSHTPKMTGNGGLLVIKVDTLVYKGKNYHINAKVTLANDKKVFFNNIKGKRLYWKNLVKSTSKGKKFYNKMWAKTKKYLKPGIEIVVSPIAFVSGTVVYVANIAVSPVLAVFSKGGRLIIPKYSSFEIKLLDDGIIYN